MNHDLADNRIVALLPDQERDALLAQCQIVSLELRDVVASPEARTKNVYFPIDAVLSMMVLLAEGGLMEVGTIGNEGVVGIEVIIGETRAIHEIYCQVPGQVIVIKANDFLSVMATSPRLAQLCQQYISGLINFLAQSVACNGRHSITERCAKWMLMTHDWVSRDDFLLTQEFLAMMLGANRSAVSISAGALQHAGMIAYSRGHVHIRNRAALQEAACECYLITKKEFERALRINE